MLCFITPVGGIHTVVSEEVPFFFRDRPPPGKALTGKARQENFLATVVMIGPVGRERSFAGAFHQGSHALQSFGIFFFFFLTLEGPFPGSGLFLQLPFTSCSLTPQKSLFPPPRPLSHFPVHLTRGERKKVTASTPQRTFLRFSGEHLCCPQFYTLVFYLH